MTNHKVVGPDNIPADPWQLLGPIAVKYLTKLFNVILTTAKIPEHRGAIATFYLFIKIKKDISGCGNFRDIILTSYA